MTNRLAAEASPYLQQHAHNPVDWYPWGPEALARAKAEDKPILLSIGYSACHWCHVMERESFENEAIAKQMNALFVNVKVDREERPDLDQVYQLVVQLLGRNGGWPLTVFLTPDQKPFFGGTYFPPVDRYGMPSFPKILDAVAEAYREKRGDVDLQADELTQAISKVAGGNDARSTAEVPRDVLARAVAVLGRRFDDEHGGFGARPKFPNTMCLDLLLLHGVTSSDDRALARFRRALDGMRDGGIHDQLGGGFHRYSTDERWLVPHFEKMLYDNALLLRLYADGHRVFGDESYADVARGIVAYLERDMRAPSGAFFASEDADSEGEEGKFFVFRPKEVRDALAGDDVAIDAALHAWGIEEGGNFEETGATVLHRALPLSTIAVKLGRAPSDVEAALERAKKALFAAREKRPRPFRDEKILTSWNALAIQALANAASAVGEPRWVDLARAAYAHLREHLVVSRGDALRAQRLEKGGVVKGPGFLDDQAYLACAALELHAATGEAGYLRDAERLADGLLADFAAEGGGFDFSPHDAEKLIAAPRDAYDQAVPSGSAMAMLALLHLGGTVRARFAEPARAATERTAAAALENPFAYATTLRALDQLVRGAVDVFVAGTPDETKDLALAATSVFVPHLRVIRSPANDPVAPELGRGRTDAAGRAFVCVGQTCSLPTSDGTLLRSTLTESAKSLK